MRGDLANLTESVDQFVRELGVNPYFVTLALFATLGPVAYKLARALWSAGAFFVGAVRLGIRKMLLRRVKNSIRGAVRADDLGFFTNYALRLHNIYMLIMKTSMKFGFLMVSIPLVYFISASYSPEYASYYAAAFVMFAGLAHIADIVIELTNEIWKREFQLKSYRKKLAYIEKLKISLDGQVNELNK